MSPTFFDGNQVTLLCNGAEYFPALEAAVDGATTNIYLETYIFEYDRSGKRISSALRRAAARGVTVQVLVDGFGARDTLPLFREQFAAAGVRLLTFRPDLATFNLRRSRLRRLHRKLALIDGRVGFVGGINIIDDMDTPGHVPPRVDFAVRLEGPILREIHHHMWRLWSLLALISLSEPRPRSRNPTEIPPAEARGKQRVAFVVRDNLRHRRDIEDTYLSAIEGAKSEIVLANAYFFPGARFRHALTQAAGRGVSVVLLLQGRVEYALLHYASRALYGTLLDSGVRIHEYGKSFLHAKVAVIDTQWATVGSSNIDPFSLLLAREANVVIDDAAFAATLRTQLFEIMADGAVELAPSAWKQRPLTSRVLTWLGYGLARLLMGIAGYARRH